MAHIELTDRQIQIMDKALELHSQATITSHGDGHWTEDERRDLRVEIHGIRELLPVKV